jgi:hypothetical protein
MRLFRLFHAILREIFEESAYERFRNRMGVEAGRDSYSQFLREREHIKNVKCC